MITRIDVPKFQSDLTGQVYETKEAATAAECEQERSDLISMGLDATIWTRNAAYSTKDGYERFLRREAQIRTALSEVAFRSTFNSDLYLMNPKNTLTIPKFATGQLVLEVLMNVSDANKYADMEKFIGKYYPSIQDQFGSVIFDRSYDLLGFFVSPREEGTRPIFIAPVIHLRPLLEYLFKEHEYFMKQYGAFNFDN